MTNRERLHQLLDEQLDRAEEQSPGRIEGKELDLESVFLLISAGCKDDDSALQLMYSLAGSSHLVEVLRSVSAEILSVLPTPHRIVAILGLSAIVQAVLAEEQSNDDDELASPVQ